MHASEKARQCKSFSGRSSLPMTPKPSLKEQEKQLHAAQEKRAGYARTLAGSLNISSKSRIFNLGVGTPDTSAKSGVTPSNASPSRRSRVETFPREENVSLERRGSSSDTRRRTEKNFSDMFGRTSPARRSNVRTELHDLAISKDVTMDTRSEIAGRNATHWKSPECNTPTHLRKNLSSNAVVPSKGRSPGRPSKPEEQQVFKHEKICQQCPIIMDISAEVARRVRERQQAKAIGSGGEGHAHQLSELTASERKRLDLASGQVRIGTGSPPRHWDDGRSGPGPVNVSKPTCAQRKQVIVRQRGCSSPPRGRACDYLDSLCVRRDGDRPAHEDGRSWWQEGGAAPCRIFVARRVVRDAQASPPRGGRDSPLARSGQVTPRTSTPKPSGRRSASEERPKLASGGASPPLFFLGKSADLGAGRESPRARGGQRSPREERLQIEARTSSPSRPFANPQDSCNTAQPTGAATPQQNSGVAVRQSLSIRTRVPSPLRSPRLQAKTPARHDDSSLKQESFQPPSIPITVTPVSPRRSRAAGERSRSVDTPADSARATYVKSVLMSNYF